jgi:hypothetical protein
MRREGSSAQQWTIKKEETPLRSKTQALPAAATGDEKHQIQVVLMRRAIDLWASHSFDGGAIRELKTESYPPLPFRTIQDVW